MERRIGLFSLRARSSASAPHGNQSTGFVACWRRYGLLSWPSRFSVIAASVRSVEASAEDISTDRMQSSRCRRAIVACGLLAIASLPVAHADPLAVVNTARHQTCGSTSAALVRAAALDAAARGVAEGKSLRAAIDASGYRAVTSTVIRLDGVRDDDEF